eukprot:scaffold297660_cov14-Prasinocladus_malaysianus.AAC.1
MDWKGKGREGSGMAWNGLEKSECSGKRDGMGRNEIERHEINRMKSELVKQNLIMEWHGRK